MSCYDIKIVHQHDVDIFILIKISLHENVRVGVICISTCRVRILVGSLRHLFVQCICESSGLPPVIKSSLLRPNVCGGTAAEIPRIKSKAD